MDNAVVIDKWYYIMDKRFCFYRLNNDSQLVAAINKAEADVFSYEEAKRRIGTGKRAQFYAMVPAEEEELTVPFSIEPAKSGLTVMDGISNQQDTNTYDLSDCENLSVMEQLKLYREQRRTIKDNMLISDTFHRLIGTSNNIAKSKETIKAIDGLGKRKYTPRQLTELFEGKSLEVPKKMTKFPECKQQEVMQMQNREDEMEAVEEEYIWKETIFDKESMDWKQYAKQQIEFFGQAKQYSCNLQIELDEIEARIQEILAKVENANYNAVQGYNVFKQLKTLRNQRKEKLRELECVETLTSCFDCEYLHEAYGYCLGEIEEIMRG